MNTEIWKEVKGYEDSYEVSDFGRVRSINRYVNNRHGGLSLKVGKILIQHASLSGRLHVGLSKNSKSKSIDVHKLVALAFLDHTPCGNDLVIDHIDHNHLNNNLSNLQLITHRENTTKDRNVKKGRLTGAFYLKNGGKWQSKIYINGNQEYLGTFTTELEAHNAYMNKLKIHERNL